MPGKDECFHQHAEWNYGGNFGHCPECGAAFSDMRIVFVRAGAGRVRRVVRSVYHDRPLDELVEAGEIRLV